MALITLTYVFTVGTTIIASQTNLNNTTIYNDYNGNITDANISASAAIEYTKLALSGTIKQSDISSTFGSASGFGMVPSGGIILWSGAANAIPSGYFLCNGSNGTPNLENQFVIGAGNTYAVGATGGSTTITQANLPSYSLSIPVYANANTGTNVESGGGSQTGTATINSGGSGTAYLPPYYALCYIMKS
jgi:hypothetical protein